MTRLLHGLLLLSLLIGCQSRASQPLPIPEEELPPILLDLHLAESAAQNLYGSSHDSIIEVYYQQVCTIHKVERADLDSTLVQLRRDPERMHRVYNQMLGLIAEREAELSNNPQ